MINILLKNKCSILDCENNYEFLTDENLQVCYFHHPEQKNFEIVQKRLCKYCDMEEKSKYICSDCQNIKNKKEWMVVRYIRKNISTRFEYDTSNMLNGCSKRRPDIFFDLPTHCVIVEIHQFQHKSYAESCECARINEIVNGIGGDLLLLLDLIQIKLQ